MMPAKTTPADLLSSDQKEAIKQAHRANNRLERIYNFYAMLAGNDVKLDLREALKRAEEAVDVWMEFDDANRISMYDMVDENRAYLGKFLEQMQDVAKEARKKNEKKGRRERLLRHGAKS